MDKLKNAYEHLYKTYHIGMVNGVYFYSENGIDLERFSSSRKRNYPVIVSSLGLIYNLRTKQKLEKGQEKGVLGFFLERSEN